MVDFRQRHGARHNARLVLAGLEPVRVAPQLHHLLHRKVKGHAAILHHHRAALGELLGCPARERQAIKKQLAAMGLPLAGHRAEQAGLARTIGPDDGRDPARLDAGVQADQGIATGHTNGQVVQVPAAGGRLPLRDGTALRAGTKSFKGIEHLQHRLQLAPELAQHGQKQRHPHQRGEHAQR